MRPTAGPYQYPIRTTNNMESRVMEPPIGSSNTLIMLHTVASASATAANASCLALTFLFLLANAEITMRSAKITTAVNT